MQPLTDDEKARIRRAILKSHHTCRDCRLWEVWTVSLPSYRHAAGENVADICEGTYEEVIEYALDQPYFWCRNKYDPDKIHYGCIEPFKHKIKNVSAEALQVEKLKDLVRKREEIDKAIDGIKDALNIKPKLTGIEAALEESRKWRMTDEEYEELMK